MTKCKHCLLGSLLCLITAATVFTHFTLSSRTAITYENYERIEIGMTQAEVEAILGGPARNESTDDTIPDDEDELLHYVLKCFDSHKRDLLWSSNSAIIRIDFHHQRVVSSDCVRVHPENALEKLCRWLGL